jgi:hypothetical protein
MEHWMGSRASLVALDGNISFFCQEVLNVSSRLPGYMQNAGAYFMFEFPCIIRLYYIRNQQEVTLAVCLLVTARLLYMQS